MFFVLRVLFVCSGNTCRSPMAAALLNQKAALQDLPVSATCAGLAAFAGDAASENAVTAMRECGVDLSGHRSRRLTPFLLEESDLVVCMSEAHRHALLPFVPPEKLLVPPGGVLDPYGGDLDTYRACRDSLAAYIDTLLLRLAEPVVAPMTESDVPAVAALERECFSVPWSEAALCEELTNENAVFLTAKRFGEVCGYVGLHSIVGEGYLCNLAVAKDSRRRGIGRTLMTVAIASCKERACAFLSLEVRPSNAAAIALYTSLGFTQRGTRKAFYTQPDEDALIMTLDLE